MKTIHQERCGAFGKVPLQADFINHHLSTEITQQWHQWLQSCLSVSQEQLGDTWLEYYITSPVWHFAVMPGIVHQHSVVGVMIPSVDQIGRYFPLIIAHAGEHDVWSAYLHGDDWFNKIAALALSSLDDDIEYDQLIGTMESLPLPKFTPLPRYSTQSSSHSYSQHKCGTCQVIERESNINNDQEFALSLLPMHYEQHYGRHGLWWTKGSEILEPCLAVSSNLPDPGQYAAMLDGKWQQWAWDQKIKLKSTS